MSDVTVASTSTSPTAEAELAHAASADWRKPFVPETKTEEVKTVDETEKKTEESTEVKTEEKVEEKTEVKEEKKEKAKSGSWQDRVDKLTTEKYRLKDELEVARKELEAAKKTTETKSEVVGDPEPKEADFKGDMNAFLKAQAKWEARQEIKAERAKELEAVEHARQQETFDNYNKGITELRGKHEDFDEVMDGLDKNVGISPATQVAIVESDNGPDIVWYLAHNPDLCKDLLELSQARQAIEIGRLSLYLESQGEAEKKKAGEKSEEKSEAKAEEKKEEVKEEKKPVVLAKPKPVTPVGGKVASTVALDQLPYQEYKIKRREQMKTSGHLN